MDDRRFDSLARATARAVSRRQVLGTVAAALVASLAGAGRAGAQERRRPLGLGEACHADGQCEQLTDRVYCAENGFDYDGAYNCCVGWGAYCGHSDEFCCGNLVCDGGYCSEGHTFYLGAGEPCYQDSQCRAADTPLYCADNGFDYDGSLNCCAYEGSRCFADEGCCGSAVCNDGFCGYYPVYLSAGDQCWSDDQCRAADTALFCADNGFAYDGPFNCCTYQGGRCFADEGCCGLLGCFGGFCG